MLAMATIYEYTVFRLVANNYHIAHTEMKMRDHKSHMFQIISMG